MAGEISALSALGAPQGDLLVELVDDGDTTMSVNGTNRKAIYGGPILLADPITNVTAGEFDFDSIPAGFNRIRIIGTVRSDESLTADTLEAFINGLTTKTLYESDEFRTYAGNIYADDKAAEPRIGVIVADSAPANSYSKIEIVIEDYAGSNLKQIECRFSGYRGASEIVHGFGMALHKTSTAAITQVQIRANGHPTDGLVGTLRLYGEM